MKLPNLRSNGNPVFFSSFLYVLSFALLLSGCSRVLHLSSVQPEKYEIRSGPEDPDVEAMIAPYKVTLDEKMLEQIGTCRTSLYKDKPEGTLCNWLCDAVASEVRTGLNIPVDFAIQNYGGIRINEIPAGPVTVGKIYELMPFDNLVVVLEGNGHVVRQLADFMARGGGWPVSEGLRYQIRDTVAVDITVGGVPLDPEKIYHFALPDYVANGGDNLDFINDLPRTSPDLLVRDALINAVKRTTARGEELEAVEDGRVKYAK